MAMVPGARANRALDLDAHTARRIRVGRLQVVLVGDFRQVVVAATAGRGDHDTGEREGRQRRGRLHAAIRFGSGRARQPFQGSSK
jgi:hypothetical protein